MASSEVRSECETGNKVISFAALERTSARDIPGRRDSGKALIEGRPTQHDSFHRYLPEKYLASYDLAAVELQYFSARRLYS